MPDKPKCAGRVYDRYHNFPCSKTGSLEHDGKFWCKTHHPPTVKEKRDAKHAKWKEGWDAEQAGMAAKAKEDAFREWAATFVRERHPLVVKSWEERNGAN